MLCLAVPIARYLLLSGGHGGADHSIERTQGGVIYELRHNMHGCCAFLTNSDRMWLDGRWL